MNENYILVGLGSIGISHLKVISERNFGSITVIDIDPGKEGFLHEIQPQAKFLSDLDAIDSVEPSTIVVIANWGPDHFKLIADLKEKGARNFIVEKPLVSKLTDLESLENFSKLNQIKMICNFSIGFSPLRSQLIEVIEDLQLGKLCNISVHGGAKCLATNGIHYLALANDLFNSNPISVSSNAENGGINPRGEELVFLGGYANWTYSDSRNLAILFSNSSHNQLQINLEFEFGRVIIEGDQATPYSIPLEDRRKLDKPSRTLYPKLTQSRVFSISRGDDFAGIRSLYEYFLSESVIDSKFLGIVECEALISVLISSLEKRVIELPISESHRNVYKEFDWKIS